MRAPISILIADDHSIVRAGIRNLFEQQRDMKVVAEADNGRRAVELAKEFSPSVIVMDISMPELNGVEATRQIVADSPNAKVIALSANADRRYVSEALKAGAKGYLPKAVPFEELTAAIRAVASGKIYLSAGGQYGDRGLRAWRFAGEVVGIHGAVAARAGSFAVDLRRVGDQGSGAAVDGEHQDGGDASGAADGEAGSEQRGGTDQVRDSRGDYFAGRVSEVGERPARLATSCTSSWGSIGLGTKALKPA